MNTFPLPHDWIYLTVKICVLVLAISIWFAVSASPAK